MTLATITIIAAVLISMAVLPGHRLELWLFLGLAAIVVVIGVRKQHKGSHPSALTSCREPSETTAGPEAPY